MEGHHETSGLKSHGDGTEVPLPTRRRRCPRFSMSEALTSPLANSTLVR
jgi:hypothetical protein